MERILVAIHSILDMNGLREFSRNMKEEIS